MRMGCGICGKETTDAFEVDQPDPLQLSGSTGTRCGVALCDQCRWWARSFGIDFDWIS